MSYYQKCFWRVLTNTLVFSLVPITLFAYYEVLTVQTFELIKCLTDILTSLILTEILFYCMHRFLHIPWFYSRFHKEHHQIIAPVGFSAVYMTPIDFVFGNALPVYLPLYLVGAHAITIKIWILITTINTVVFSHSGFKGWADFHDLHHSHFNKNYGTNLFMDRIFGTIKYAHKN